MTCRGIEANLLTVAIERDDLGFDAPAPLGHPARLSKPDDHQAGPSIGEAVPDFRLPDAYGREVHLEEARGECPAVVLFYRSAVW